MLKIDPTAAPAADVTRLEVAPGVVFLLRPWTSAYAVFGRRAAAALGEDVNPEDREMAFTAGVAQRALAGWEGIGDLAGEPIEPSPEAIAAVFAKSYAVYSAFDTQYVTPNLVGAEEKNGSSVSLNGTSTAGRNTAGSANRPKAAPVKSARTKSTTRKQTPARSSGK